MAPKGTHLAHKPFELEDGTSEVVETSPRRSVPAAASVEAAVGSPVGGKVAQLQAGRAAAQDGFIAVRGPLGAARILTSHLEVLAVLWRLWAAKRAAGEDPGVSAQEVIAAKTYRLSNIKIVLKTLVKSGVVRSVLTQAGWQGRRVAYFPTEIGIQLLAVAETFGGETSIQIGGTATAWKNRSNSEPRSFFEHALLLINRKDSLECLE